MWFKKKIELFNHPLIEKVDKELSSILKVDLITSNLEILERLSKEEQKQSGITSSDLLLIYEKKKEELMKFTCYCHSKESKIEHIEEFASSEDSIQHNPDLTNIGLSKGFSITYAIYYYFLSKGDNAKLMDYLSVRRIPYYKKFHERLLNYFHESKGVMLSDSYIQYVSGYHKENVTIEDIDKAIIDVQKMDKEHGLFWISKFVENEEEYVIEVNKGLKISIIYEKKVDIQYNSQDWDEVRLFLKMHIDRKFEEIISLVTGKNEIQKKIWRNKWLHCINELTSLELQKKSWLDKTNKNPHWSFVEFMCCYFDDLVIDDNYKIELTDGWISKSEFETIKPWHELLNKYDSPCNDDYDVEAILADKKWQMIIEEGKKAKSELSKLLSIEENQILNEEINYTQFIKKITKA